MNNSSFSVDQFKTLLEASRQYEALFYAAQPELNSLAERLHKGIQNAFKELGGSDSLVRQLGYYWLSNHDFIEILCEDGKIQAEFWERGRCGNRDECVHTIEITADMLEPGGVERYVEAWRIQRLTAIDSANKKAEAERLHKIKNLEAELSRLNGGSPHA